MKTTNKYWIYLEWLNKGGYTNFPSIVPLFRQKFDLPRTKIKQIYDEWKAKYNPADYR